MQKTYLVAGATGRVGGEVVQALLARGEQVRVLVRTARQAEAFAPTVERTIGSMNDRESLRRAMEGVAGAFFVTPHDPDEERLGRNYIEVAEEVGVPRLVFSAAIHPDSDGWLASRWYHLVMGMLGPHYRPKLAVERRMRRFTGTWVNLLPSNFMQNDECWADEVQGGVFPHPQGLRPVNRVDVRDLAEAAARALTDARVATGSYALVGPRSLTGPECAEVWSRTLGVTVRYFDADVDAWAKAYGHGVRPEALDSWKKTFRLLQKYGLETEARMVARTTALLGRPPGTYEQYVADTAKRWREARSGKAAGPPQFGARKLLPSLPSRTSCGRSPSCSFSSARGTPRASERTSPGLPSRSRNRIARGRPPGSCSSRRDEPSVS